jgi:hypothetical protein
MCDKVQFRVNSDPSKFEFFYTFDLNIIIRNESGIFLISKLQQELSFPGLFGSMQAAMRPVIAISKCRVSVKTLAACALRLVEEQPQLYERLVGGRKEGADEIEDSL